ncbi:DUF3006 domain-containing protein [Corallococcus sp. AB011P]|uniref:DUF3006 domain-containing protein n=1 Tax=unclassified Corallococcus TaxID=2685029 RepID=UPI000EA0A7C8|nr:MULTISPECIES: DUF3006 domain-containing protein [unclassified Corallococcus]RKG53067.1 DUF3006 domain-containing protein [Corallococcus sp. AB011P]RKH81914.1 DUF3006 domain-containing protein [Corallococcus sp. AB045]
MTKKKTKARSRATVDRIEDDVAVLVVDGQQVTRALDTLPPGVREGDVVDLETGTVDAEATESLRADVRAAREQAMRGKKPPAGDFDL